jgi:hypothetical protein
MPQPPQPEYSGIVINGLMRALRNGEAGLSEVPKLIERIITDNMWQHFVVESTREEVTHKRFIDFITAKHPLALVLTGAFALEKVVKIMLPCD